MQRGREREKEEGGDQNQSALPPNRVGEHSGMETDPGSLVLWGVRFLRTEDSEILTE